MRKIIAAINMTLDGYCDHTAVIPDDDLHTHYSELIRNAGVILYGRITYKLMEDYWPSVVTNPTGNKSTDEFALSIHNVQKIVFSRTLKSVNWENARIAKKNIKEEVEELRQQSGNYILAGSRSMIVELTKLNLIDEYQLCVHPVIAGGGLPLFKDITDRVILSLIKTKKLSSGAIVLYYEPVRN